jgi:hypothetical protein
VCILRRNSPGRRTYTPKVPATGRGVDADTSQFDVGDLFVQPLWLGWSLTHWDFTFGYGFYAPVGKYDTSTVTLPGGTTVTAEAADNIGLGFWTHQLQGAVTWYPWANKGTAVLAALTYEIHGDKEDFDLTPGQNLTLNWGISQFLPLTKVQKLLLEAGLTGYSSWQITDDSGSDARNSNVHDEVHAVGGQLGLTYVPWFASLNMHYFGEFASQDRFQGHVFGVSVAKKFVTVQVSKTSLVKPRIDVIISSHDNASAITVRHLGSYPARSPSVYSGA